MQLRTLRLQFLRLQIAFFQISKIRSLIFAFSILLSSPNLNASQMREVRCLSPSLCASLTFEAMPNSKEESVFDIEFIGDQSAEVESLGVDLWMPMGDGGHSSAPVEFVKTTPTTYQVSNAWFVMRGGWQVRLTFNSNTGQNKIIFPIQITE